MVEKYTVVTMSGDYPLENQANWGVEFVTEAAAISAAAEQQHTMMEEDANVYTLVLYAECETHEDDVLWLTHAGIDYTGEKAQLVADLLPMMTDHPEDVIGMYFDYVNRVKQLENLVGRIQSALGTAEVDDALVEVAQNAHRSERELAERDWDGNDPPHSVS